MHFIDRLQRIAPFFGEQKQRLAPRGLVHGYMSTIPVLVGSKVGGQRRGFASASDEVDHGNQVQGCIQYTYAYVLIIPYTCTHTRFRQKYRRWLGVAEAVDRYAYTAYGYGRHQDQEDVVETSRPSSGAQAYMRRRAPRRIVTASTLVRKIIIALCCV
jgi:hypothetical protein